MPPFACTGGTPTVGNTNAISVFNRPGGEGNVLGIAGPKLFAPGDPRGRRRRDRDLREPQQRVEGWAHPPARQRYRRRECSHRQGWNQPNATPAEDQPDVDVFLNQASVSGAAGGPGPDNFSAQGGAGTGSALANTIVLAGGEGANVLTGGDGDDFLLGAGGTNTLLGMGGGDTLIPGPNDDTVDGGAGTDTADFIESAIAVSVDLAIVGPQSTGGGNDSLTNVENLGGTEGPDVLRGDSGPNRLASGVGDDIVEGRGGNDTLDTSEGEDALDVRDGGPDTAICGTDADADTVTADLPGIDLLTGCETVIFPAAPAPAPAPAGAMAPHWLSAPTRS